MKSLKRFSLLLMMLAFSSSLLLAETSNNFAIQITDLLDTVNQKDVWAVRDWLRSKRVSLNNKTGDFSISGDVKTQWRNVHQHLASINIVNGPSSPSGWSNNLYTVDFRLYFDYKSDKTWASIKLDFDEAAGLFQGEADNLALVRANIGYHLYDDGNTRLDLMIGRQRAYELYDSQIQFNSTLDGFTGIYATAIDNLCDFSFHGGGYIFNAVANHPVWIIQAGMYDIYDTGIYFEYSFINWSKNTSSTRITSIVSGETVLVGPEKWSYRNNQFILGYVFNPEFIGRDLRLYGGMLWNALANAGVMADISNNQTDSTQSLAGWIALQVGTVQRAGDWAFQAQWQVLQPYSVPDWDVAGMGRGNGSDSALIGINEFSKVQNFPGNGNANYNGWSLDLLYSITNELVLEARFQRALSTTAAIGFKTNYSNFLLAAIYGF